MNVTRRTGSQDDRQVGTRSALEIRTTLLALTREFVRGAHLVEGVDRIAMVGSLLTDKPRPKDIDVVVSLNDRINLVSLARLGRRLKGSAQSKVGAGADIFLADANDEYIGRICHYRECHRRILCRARHCGARPHLADDLDVVDLRRELIAEPPVQLYPAVACRVSVPADVECVLLGPLRRDLAHESGSEHDTPAI